VATGAKTSLRDVPTRKVRLGPQDVRVERRSDGSILLHSPQPLEPYPTKLTGRLEHWARVAPDRTLFAQRAQDGGWRRVSYAQALREARRIGQALLRRNLSAERPIAILSGNDIEHALLTLGALYAGIPHAPISPAYSLVSIDLARLRAISALITPGLVFACDGTQFGRALDAVMPSDAELVVTRNPPAGRATLFRDLAVEPTQEVDAAHAQVGPETIAKFLFTSGSTGIPKCVINTQRMWCANQQMLVQALAYFADEAPVILDWAPWHHTAGGNHDFGLVIYNGGTFYLDEGKPMPGAIEETVRNLREIAPTWYFTVPKGYEALLPYLRQDEALRRNFFSRLKLFWFAGAGIAQHVFDEIQRLAVETCGERILFLTGFGATETAPFALSRTWHSDNAANMGLPAAGMELKLVPAGGKLEARVRGPNITPGYWRQSQFTTAAFDEEGFYKLGDAFKFAAEDDPKHGLLFDGRIAEDFKLSTGTWVSVGPLRAQFIELFAPLVRDVVIAGADKSELTALVFPAAGSEGQRQQFKERLHSFATNSTGSSNRICRIIVVENPPSIDTGEMTDKGSINQRAVLQNRAALVDELYAEPLSSRVISIED
jgi:feruloyl-CoA synthase